jgi:hypothetical protein
MPKDALGHGSDERGVHAAAINSLPQKGALSSLDWHAMSDADYHATMPSASFHGQIKDLLGLWSGSQKPEPLSDSESAQCNAAYEKRDDWRAVARLILDQRRASQVH